MNNSDYLLNLSIESGIQINYYKGRVEFIILLRSKWYEYPLEQI